VIGVVLAIGFLVSMCSGSDDGDSSGNEYGARSARQNWIKDQLKAPSTADFSDVETSGIGPWTVTGVVDAENSFGAMLRSHWTCDGAIGLRRLLPRNCDTAGVGRPCGVHACDVAGHR
jgi:hypothetical protein